MKRFYAILLTVSLLLGLLSGTSGTLFAQKKYNESPMLAELVKQGKLPPVGERLPKKPLVVGPGVLISKTDLPDWQVGKYGGTLRMVQSIPNWNADIYIANKEPILFGPGIGEKGIPKPNVVESYEGKEDRIFTFKLREGMRWSDGTPVTTEDVRFVYEDMYLNEKLYPVFPSWARVGGDPKGEPMKVEIIDKYTFRVTFPKPYGGFLRQLTIEYWCGYGRLLRPSYYLKQFHIKYTPLEKLKPLLEKEGLKDEWWILFQKKDGGDSPTSEDNIGYPVLTPWMLVNAKGGIYTWERNPYYWKVDIAGNQLPYIDRIVSAHVQNVEMENMRILSGDVDFMRQDTALSNMPLYREYGEKGGFRAVLLDLHVDPIILYINLTYNDPVWRKIVQDVRFRKAICMAMNYKEIIDSLYYGYASIPTSVPAKYDVNEANRLLDQVGLNNRDTEGYRLRPDGKRFEIFIESGGNTPELVQVGDLLISYLKAVGIKANFKRIESSFLDQRVRANEVQAYVLWGHGVNDLPAYTTTVLFRDAAPLWWNWYTSGGTSGEEPPTWAKKAPEFDRERWTKIPGSKEWNKILAESIAWHRQYIPAIPLVEKAKQPLIVSARLKNVPRSGYSIAANYSLEQFFFER